ncbi:hypothetical protein A2160_05430 [Candidatus Beckwithbacteria bacterium RBG_13_42_9]|uniref:Glycosyltransferase RgtA/B/C/D-like domain-containing protein n=1 Tax=Candidatus Beckwithbacteria bacterium RBG_13_42_9 TaxID=1797457 RepID=A0A1F5E773_9BACT|nr:MAG: hypothetical protein A2160_05430 [Candidatus Beckwithbacteria bacterium RBG_13_42_9]
MVLSRLKFRNIFILTFFTALVFLILYFEALIPSWRGHLEIDTWNFYLQIKYFISQHTFAGYKNNEVLPPTLLFLLIPGFLAGWQPFDYGHYLQAFFVVIFVVLALQLWLINLQKATLLRQLMFLITLVLFGPIILFRFDGLVAFLVILSLWLWQKNKYGFSGLSLGYAAAMKVYPIIFLPYLFFLLLNQKQYFKIVMFSFCFGLGVFLPIIIYFLLGGTLPQIIEGLEFHSLKYVSIESVPGTILTGLSLWLNKRPLPLIGGYGIWGIRSPIVDAIGLEWFNRLWIFPITLFYLYLLRQKEFFKKLSWGIIYFLVLLFLIFSKNLHAQYAWWFMSLFPLLKPKKKFLTDYLIMFGLLCLIALLNQDIYPRLYTDFLDQFYKYGREVEIFYLQVLRNFLILALAVVSFKYLFIKKTVR